MPPDALLHITDDGNLSRRLIALDAANAVSVEDFHLAMLGALPGAIDLPPDAAELQRLMLLSVSLAAGFALRWSRTTAGGEGDFCAEFRALVIASREAAYCASTMEGRLVVYRALRGMPQLPSWAGPDCNSAVQAVIGLARNVIQEASQVAIDLHVKRTKRRPDAIRSKSGSLIMGVVIDVPEYEKALARRFAGGFFPPFRLVLRQAREELVGLALVDGPAARTATAPRKLEWSRPDAIEEWAKAFRCHRNTMRKRLESGVYRYEKVGRCYRLALDDLPDDVRARYIRPKS